MKLNKKHLKIVKFAVAVPILTHRKLDRLQLDQLHDRLSVLLPDTYAIVSDFSGILIISLKNEDVTEEQTLRILKALNEVFGDENTEREA